jgi:FSR family fosmidomycin resistance protein-like MFS transporter
MVATTADLRRDAKVIGLVGVAHFFSHFYVLAIPPLFPILKEAYGVSYAALGLLMAVMNIATGVFQPPVGFLVDRIGGKLVLIAGLALHALAMLLIGFSSTYAATLALMGLAGLANSVYHPADYSILNASIDRHRIGRAFSIHTFTGYLGFAAAPGAIALLSIWLGWRGALVASGVAGLAVAALLLWQRHALADDQIGGGDKGKAGSAFDFMRQPAILLAFLFFILIAAGGSGINAFSVAALDMAYATPLWAATTGLSAYLFSGAAGVLVGGQIADRTSRHGTVAAICLSVTAAMFALVATVDLGTVGLIAVLTGTGLMNGIIQPSRDMMVRAVTPPGAMGKVFGFVTSGFNVGGAIAPLGFGALLDHGLAVQVFWVVAALNLCAIVSVASVRWRRPVSA